MAITLTDFFMLNSTECISTFVIFVMLTNKDSAFCVNIP